MKNKKKNAANKFLKLYFGFILILLIGIGVWQLSKQLTVEYQNWAEKVRVQKYGDELMKKQSNSLFATHSPLPILTKETSSYKLLPTDFQIEANGFFATDTNLLFFAHDRQEYNAEGVPASTSEPERYLLSIPISKNESTEKAISSLPFKTQSYPGEIPVIAKNVMYLFAHKILTDPDQYSHYADKADGMSANIVNGTVEQWKKLSVGLPPFRPVDGNSITLYSNGNDVFATLFDDGPTESVYKLVLQNGVPSSWSKIGEIPTSLSYPENGLSKFIFLSSKLIVLIDHKLITYPIENGLLSKKIEEKNLTLPDEIKDPELIFPIYSRYQKAFVTVHNQTIYMILALKKDDDLSYLVSYSADLNEKPVVFKKVEEKRTDLDFNRIPDISFTNNNAGAFIVADQVSGNFNKVVARQLYFFPFKN